MFHRHLKIAVTLLILAVSFELGAQEKIITCSENSVEVNDASVSMQEQTDSIEIELSLPEYPEWEKASISGKLKMSGLPLSPSLKIYMEKDSIICISIKAPFMGEVGRISITQTEVMVVNKMNKTFTKEPLSELSRLYPGSLGDIQELILGRVVFPGAGVLSEETADFIEVYPNGEAFSVVPIEEIKIENFEYGYITDDFFNPMLLLVLPGSNADMNLTVFYGFDKKGYDLDISYADENRTYQATLELNYPEWKGDYPGDFKVDKKYRELPFIDFLKSF